MTDGGNEISFAAVRKSHLDVNTSDRVQNPLCEHLPWDSDFFGVRIARVLGNRITWEQGDSILEWTRAHRIDCLYFLADSDDPITIKFVLNRGFFLTDIRVQLEADLSDYSFDTDTVAIAHVRPFRRQDLDCLRSLAGTSHHYSRFYFDPSFARDRCDELYATWIERSTEGWADAVFVAEDGGKPTGYISCHLKDDTTGSIGLIAVDPTARGRGLGGALVRSALVFMKTRGARRALVATQGRNIASQRMYQRCGFMPESVRLWFHYWNRTDEQAQRPTF